MPCWKAAGKAIGGQWRGSLVFKLTGDAQATALARAALAYRTGGCV
ncbi:MAG: hypothetical protein JWM47_2852 [Acidimicrobiales bacterium]|nr:hypothetical protein [Acidimicrobiales bacterium]